MEQIQLTDDDCRCLDAVLESGVITQDFLDRCLKCGLAVDEAIKKNKEQLSMAKAIKVNFFNDRV